MLTADTLPVAIKNEAVEVRLAEVGRRGGSCYSSVMRLLSGLRPNSAS